MYSFSNMARQKCTNYKKVNVITLRKGLFFYMKKGTRTTTYEFQNNRERFGDVITFDDFSNKISKNVKFS